MIEIWLIKSNYSIIDSKFLNEKYLSITYSPITHTLNHILLIRNILKIVYRDTFKKHSFFCVKRKK